MKVVDLGTRLGSTLMSFLRRGGKFFPTHRDFISKVQTSDCVGVDREEMCRADLESLGASFECWDLSDESSLDKLPEADFYLASKVLHHFPGGTEMDNLVRTVLEKARLGVWIRLLSFESDDQTGEGVLLAEDLRFGWSKKYAPYLCKDVVSLVPRGSFNLELNPAKRIRHTNDFRVLPVSADDDKEEYEEVMGHKPQIRLAPPVVAEWDLFIERK
jgi:hypothetical protein